MEDCNANTNSHSASNSFFFSLCLPSSDSFITRCCRFVHSFFHWLVPEWKHKTTTKVLRMDNEVQQTYEVKTSLSSKHVHNYNQQQMCERGVSSSSTKPQNISLLKHSRWLIHCQKTGKIDFNFSNIFSSTSHLVMRSSIFKIQPKILYFHVWITHLFKVRTTLPVFFSSKKIHTNISSSSFTFICCFSLS